MEAPKCKLCGERHYGLCQHAKPRPAAAAMAPKRAKKTAMGTANTLASEADQQLAARPEAVKPKFDRNAYQRDLMRKRRKAQKEQG